MMVTLGQAGRADQHVGVGFRIVDDDEQMLDGAGAFAGERIPVGQCWPQHRAQFGHIVGQVARRPDTVGLAGDVDVRQPLQPRPVIAVQIRCRQGDSEDRGVVPGDGLGDPGSQCTTDVVVLTEHRYPRQLRHVDAGGCVVNSALRVEQATQGGVRDGLEVDFVGGVLDPQCGVQCCVVQAGAKDQEVGVVRVTFPLPPGAGDGGQRLRRRVRPFKCRKLFGGVGAHIVAHDGQVAQVVGAFGVDLLGAQLVVRTTVHRGGGEQQHKGEEQGRRRDQPHSGRHQRDDHADDQDDDQVRQHPPQQRRWHQPR